MYQEIAFLQMNFICELAEVKVKRRRLHCSSRVVTHPSTNPAEQGSTSEECFHYGRRFTPLSPTQNSFRAQHTQQKVNILTDCILRYQSMIPGTPRVHNQGTISYFCLYDEQS